MEGLTITDDKDSQKQPAKTDMELQCSTEQHRYRLAMLFVGSFVIILFFALLATIFWGYTGLADLVGFFSPSVAAVIGFYFLQQNTAGAQAQATTATKQSALESAGRRLAEEENRRISKAAPDVARVYDLLSQFEETKAIRAQPDVLNEMRERLRRAQETIEQHSIS